MDYSNESFEAFQTQLATRPGGEPLLWQLRDSLFCEAFYGSDRRSHRLYHLPFGAWLFLLLTLLKNARGFRRAPLATEGKAIHFLFCSARNNHLNRLYPLLDGLKAEASCQCCVSNPAVLRHVKPADRSLFTDVSREWIPNLRFGDFLCARRLVRQLRETCRTELGAWHLRKIEFFLIQFFAWSRFWRVQFKNAPREIYCTFEKAPAVKAFFVVGKQRGIAKRVHWIHGLRHASIQATAASELWCMTEGDVRFFKSRVPDDCAPLKKRNPEADILIETVGVKAPENRKPAEPVRFLFLGPGIERSYTDAMRAADLAVIRSALAALGDRVQWRFRPHPSAVDRFRTELAEAGIEANDFSGNTLTEDLAWADAVGSSWSSLLLDVRETGRPIFWVQAEVRNLGGVDELIRDGIGIHASQESLARELARIFDLEMPV